MNALHSLWRASCALALPAVCAGVSGAAPANPPPAVAPWYEQSVVGMEVGPTGAQFGYSDASDRRYAARFDGREIIRRCQSAHAEYAVVWARDGDYAYYKSAFLEPRPGLGDHDVLREAMDEAKPTGYPVIAYCVMQQYGHFLALHPEYVQRDDHGRLLDTFCFNSGYLAEMKRMAAEQLAYGIAGFHFDMLPYGFAVPGGCWCDTCRREFQAIYGQPMPPAEGWDAGWEKVLEYRYMSVQRFMRELYAYVKSVNPRASVDFNYHGNPPFSWETGQRPVQHAINADFVTGETGTWSFTPLFVGLNTEFYRAATPGRRVQVAMSRDVRMYHNQTVRPVNDLRWELYTAIAHGAFVTMVDKAAFDGALDPEAYRRIGEAFADILAHRADFGQSPVAEAGIYFSSRTRDWYGRDKPMHYFTSFAGAHKAMAYEHIPWRVVLDENTEALDPGALPVLILPDAACLAPREVALFRRYVESGGQLIVTGRTGTLDAYGQPLADSVLADLIGAHCTGHLDTTDNWVRLPAGAPGSPDEALAAGIRPDWTFLVEGPASLYRPTTARAIGDLLKPYRTTLQMQGKDVSGWPMSADSVVGPAILINQVGRGRVVTFAGSPDYSTAAERRVIESRKLLANAVRWLDPAPRLRITASPTVETVVTDDPATRTLRVHCIGYNSPPQNMPAKERSLELLGLVMPELVEDPPIFRVAVDLARPLRDAAARNASTRLQVQESRVTATIDDVHDVLLLRY